MKLLDIFRIFTSSGAFILILVGCFANGEESGITDSVKGSSLSGSRGSSAVHQWSYHGETGPEHWGDLLNEYQVAKTGTEQSPINIVTKDAVKSTLPAIEFSYDKTHIHFFNNGHTVQADITPSENSLTMGDSQFDLLQFHFHTESENSVDGKHFPVEMHMVHRNENGELAVVGVFFESGDENETLKELWENLPREDDLGYYTNRQVNLEKLIPEDRSCYRFDGSLTTPPCTEGVKWIVMSEPLEMSTKQINNFFELFSGSRFPKGNRRPIQPLNERVVVLDIAND